LQVPEQQRLLELYVVLKATPARWWVAHKEEIEDWKQCRSLMQFKFGTEVKYITQKYTGVSDPTDHVEHCRHIWSLISKKKWMHGFIHTLDTISKNWYLELEVCRETTNWYQLIQWFKVTFIFEHESPLIDASLQVIINKMFSEEEPMEVVPMCSAHRASLTIHKLL
jgi:hypothetical protein